MAEPRQAVAPAHPLPASRSDRSWRAVLIVLALAMVAIVVSSLVGAAVLGRADRASFSPVAATQELGRPAAIVLTSDLGHVTVRTSDETEQVVLRLVDADGALAEAPRARIAQHGTEHDAGGIAVDVAQPGLGLSLPWDEHGVDLELLVPSDLAATMPITATAEVGDLEVLGGSYADLALSSGAGDVTVSDAASSGQVSAAASLGDVELSLAPDAAVTGIDARSETGDVTVSVPGGRRYAVTATADMGEAATAPGIQDPQGPPLIARADMGSVSVTR